MSENSGFEEVPGRLLANMVTSLEMPKDDVIPLTQATRSVGALYMLAHLVEGDWNPSGEELMQEFLQRVIGNAARQGIVLEAVTTEAQVS